MQSSSIRVLVADDFEPWRRFTSSTLQKANLEVVDEAANGFEAVEKARDLQPHLILLDVAMPKMNGLEAARQIRVCSPNSKILFVSENRDCDIAQEALRIGASGYVLKSDAGSELLPAVEAAIRGKQFVSDKLSGRTPTENSDRAPVDTACRILAFPFVPNAEEGHRHEIAFYENDEAMLDGYARFISAALKADYVVIFVATESHQLSVRQRLKAVDVNVDIALEKGTYLSLDTSNLLSKLIVNGVLDQVGVAREFGSVIETARRANRARVVACGEGAFLLLYQGNADAAIQLERLWDEIAKAHGIDTLCGYLSNLFRDEKGSRIYKSICAAHSAVHSAQISHRE